MYATFSPSEVMNIRKEFPDLGVHYEKYNHPSVQFSSATLQVGAVVITKTSMLIGDTLEEDVTVAPVDLHNQAYALLRKVKEYVKVNYAHADL